MPKKEQMYTSTEVNGLIKDATDNVAEHYQNLLQQVRLEVADESKALHEKYGTMINAIAAQRDFVWEQYNALVNTLGANAIAVIFDEKENINGKSGNGDSGSK